MAMDIDFAAHNAQVREVWRAFHEGRPIRVPMTLGISSRFTVLNPEANTEGITYEIPTYQTRHGCVAFSASGQHFSFHTFNEPWLCHLKTQLPAARAGKGSLKIPYGCEEEAKPLLHEACRGILQASVPLAEKREAI